MDLWDDKPKPSKIHTLGDKLDDYSVDELNDLIEKLKSETIRVEKDKAAKEKASAAAADVFKS